MKYFPKAEIAISLALLTSGAGVHGLPDNGSGLTNNAMALTAGDIEDMGRWTRASQPNSTTLPTRITKLLRRQDVVTFVAPDALYPIRRIGLQCQGVNATLADVPHRTAQVHTSAGRTETRFGDAELNGVRAFRLQASFKDVLPPSTSPRCELLAYPTPDSALPSGRTFWFAFSFWADDWAGTRDEQIIAQFHTHTPTDILLNPFFALVVRGKELRAELRFNEREPPSQASTKFGNVSRVEMPVRQWVTAVIQARLTTDPARGPFFRFWLNGTQVVDYAGPAGYVLSPGAFAYPKVGVYHWTAGNPWDPAVPSRAMLVGAMLTVQDDAGRYSVDDLAAAAMPMKSK
jgi:hypothetical protein